MNDESKSGIPNPGRRLRRERVKRGWSQERAAAELGAWLGMGPLDRATVAHWELMTKYPGRDASLAIEEVFGGPPATDWSRWKRAHDRAA